MIIIDGGIACFWLSAGILTALGIWATWGTVIGLIRELWRGTVETFDIMSWTAGEMVAKLADLIALGFWRIRGGR